MELVKTVLSIKLIEAFNAFLEIRNVLRVASGKKEAELQGPPLIIDQIDKKQRVEYHVRALVIQQEAVNNENNGIAKILEKIADINTASKLPKIEMYTSESFFIEPYPLPFHEVLIRVKNCFLVPNHIINQTTDVGLSFDQLENGIIKNFRFGPMQKNNLENNIYCGTEIKSQKISSLFLIVTK